MSTPIATPARLEAIRLPSFPVPERPHWFNDEVVRRVVVVVGPVAIILGIALSQSVRPFPWLGAVLLLALATGTRVFGIPLPGKGFASFAVGTGIASMIALGWAPGGLVAALGILLGDALVRRLPLRNAVGNAGHFATASAVSGIAYAAANGLYGPLALTSSNFGRLMVLIVIFLFTVNATFYFQLKLSPAIAWVDARLTARWEGTIAVVATMIALAALWLAYVPELTPRYLGAWTMLFGLALLMHWLVRQGAAGESLQLVHRMTSVISARPELSRALDDIQRLTRSLVPWEEMGIASYDAGREEFVVVADTSSARPRGLRFSSRTAMAGEALRRRRAITDLDLSGSVPIAGGEMRGSEILVPLRYGERLVGLWSVRHSRTAMYRRYDAALLEYLAPQLALSLSLDALIQPVLTGSEVVAQHVDAITGTTQQLHASSQESAETARRLAATVRLLADTLSKGADEARMAQAVADSTVSEGQDTEASGTQMLEDARVVRQASEQAMSQLTTAAAIVQEGAEQVLRLQSISGAVQRFGQTITTLADQTGLLALNAAVEAARAGAHGRGFAVVAQEIRALADKSAAEAEGMDRAVRDIRATLEKAVALMQRTRSEVLSVADASRSWVDELDRIVAASETVAAAGHRIVDAARENAQRSLIMAQALAESQHDAVRAAMETETVAGASTQQESAIHQLNEAAMHLSATAHELAVAVAVVRAASADDR